MDLSISNLAEGIDSLKRLRLASLKSTKNLNHLVAATSHAEETDSLIRADSRFEELHAVIYSRSASLVSAHSAIGGNVACIRQSKKNPTKERTDKKDLSLASSIESLQTAADANLTRSLRADVSLSFVFIRIADIPEPAALMTFQDATDLHQGLHDTLPSYFPRDLLMPITLDLPHPHQAPSIQIPGLPRASSDPISEALVGQGVWEDDDCMAIDGVSDGDEDDLGTGGQTVDLTGERTNHSPLNHSGPLLPQALEDATDRISVVQTARRPSLIVQRKVRLGPAIHHQAVARSLPLSSGSEDEIEDEEIECTFSCPAISLAPQRNVPVIIGKKRTLVTSFLDHEEKIDSISDSEDLEGPQMGELSEGSLRDLEGPQMVAKPSVHRGPQQFEREHLFDLKSLDSYDPQAIGVKQKRHFRSTFNPETLLTTTGLDGSSELSNEGQDIFLEKLLGDKFIPKPKVQRNQNHFDWEIQGIEEGPLANEQSACEMNHESGSMSLDDDDFAAIDAAIAMHTSMRDPYSSVLCHQTSAAEASPNESEGALMIDDDDDGYFGPDLRFSPSPAPPLELSLQRLPTASHDRPLEEVEGDDLIVVEHDAEYFILEEEEEEPKHVHLHTEDAEEIPDCEILNSSDDWLEHEAPIPPQDIDQDQEMGGLMEMNQAVSRVTPAQRRIMHEIRQMKESVKSKADRGFTTNFLSSCLSDREVTSLQDLFIKSELQPNLGSNESQIFVSLLCHINNQNIRLE